MLNTSVIVALVLDQYAGLAGADAVFGLLIALWLLWGAWTSSSHALDQLMDREWPEDLRDTFLAACAEYPELAGLHDLRTRTSGTHQFRPVPCLGACRLDDRSRRMSAWTASRRSCSTGFPRRKS